MDDAERKEAAERVSVEKALNSRCSSDFSAGPRATHHGTFDPNCKLPGEDFARLISIAESTPRFTQWPLRVFQEADFLIVHLSADAHGIDADWLHIEAGMQEYAVMISAAALGVGCRIREFSVDGDVLPTGWVALVNLLLNPVYPLYGDSLWTTDAPGDPNPWVPANLPDPRRDGDVLLFEAIPNLALEREGESQASREVWGQLLWAGRGRTPHFYHGTPWGMTVPVWVGQQTLTHLYLTNAEGSYRYVNWIGERPTHSVTKFSSNRFEHFRQAMDWPGWASAAILIDVNDDRRVAQWEAGFEIEAMLLEAASLGIPCQARLLTEQERDSILRLGIPGIQAALLF